MQTQYADPRSISELHKCALTLLAHFHYCNKGQLPFALAKDPARLQEFTDAAELNTAQVQFVQQTSVMVQSRCE
jgi:hypothetical protein